MREDYRQWLKDKNYSDNTQIAQLTRVRRVEECYGSLDEHFRNGTSQEVINSLQYSSADARGDKPNPSKIRIDGNIQSNLRDYKGAAQRYLAFLSETAPINDAVVSLLESAGQQYADEKAQRITLERDMQRALRENIKSLGSTLEIIDNGEERGVATGLIDITCKDGNAIVVIELKAGTADSRAIGQVLGYMGDLMNEDDGHEVRGILVAHDFDARCKAAARAVPGLQLKKYSIEFRFSSV